VLAHFFAVLRQAACRPCVATDAVLRLRDCEQVNARVLRPGAWTRPRSRSTPAQLHDLVAGLLPAHSEPTGAPGEVILFTIGDLRIAQRVLSTSMPCCAMPRPRMPSASGRKTSSWSRCRCIFRSACRPGACDAAMRRAAGRHGPAVHDGQLHARRVRARRDRVVVDASRRRALLAAGADFVPFAPGADRRRRCARGRARALLLARRPGRELYLTYGLTQCGPRVSTLAAHRSRQERLGSVGLPLPGTDVRLRDLGDESDMTELLVASDTVMKQRVGCSRAAARRLRRAWRHGDLFERDAAVTCTSAGASPTSSFEREKINLASIGGFSGELPHVTSVQAAVSAGPTGKRLRFAPERHTSRRHQRERLPRLLRDGFPGVSGRTPFRSYLATEAFRATSEERLRE